jgi:hypothetical protein
MQLMSIYELLVCHSSNKATMYLCLLLSTTDKKENKIFLTYKEIQSGAIAKSYTRKGFLIYEEMRKYFTIYEKAGSHI